VLDFLRVTYVDFLRGTCVDFLWGTYVGREAPPAGIARRRKCGRGGGGGGGGACGVVTRRLLVSFSCTFLGVLLIVLWCLAVVLAFTVWRKGGACPSGRDGREEKDKIS